MGGTRAPGEPRRSARASGSPQELPGCAPRGRRRRRQGLAAVAKPTARAKREPWCPWRIMTSGWATAGPLEGTSAPAVCRPREGGSGWSSDGPGSREAGDQGAGPASRPLRRPRAPGVSFLGTRSTAFLPAGLLQRLCSWPSDGRQDSMSGRPLPVPAAQERRAVGQRSHCRLGCVKWVLGGGIPRRRTAGFPGGVDTGLEVGADSPEVISSVSLTLTE